MITFCELQRRGNKVERTLVGYARNSNVLGWPPRISRHRRAGWNDLGWYSEEAQISKPCVGLEDRRQRYRLN